MQSETTIYQIINNNEPTTFPMSTNIILLYNIKEILHYVTYLICDIRELTLDISD